METITIAASTAWLFDGRAARAGHRRGRLALHIHAAAVFLRPWLLLQIEIAAARSAPASPSGRAPPLRASRTSAELRSLHYEGGDSAIMSPDCRAATAIEALREGPNVWPGRSGIARAQSRRRDRSRDIDYVWHASEFVPVPPTLRRASSLASEIFALIVSSVAKPLRRRPGAPRGEAVEELDAVGAAHERFVHAALDDDTAHGTLPWSDLGA